MLEILFRGLRDLQLRVGRVGRAAHCATTLCSQGTRGPSLRVVTARSHLGPAAGGSGLQAHAGTGQATA